uniref:DDE-1 domain-containing protein n=1 Tax=Strigamia maritima TaxID=126957 RepID=T1IH48_STRMM
MPGEKTVEHCGAKIVPVLTTGHEKARVTVCLAAMADGKKLKPMIVFKGKRMPKELVGVKDVIIVMSKNGWMLPEMTTEWLRKVWSKDLFCNRRLLV